MILTGAKTTISKIPSTVKDDPVCLLIIIFYLSPRPLFEESLLPQQSGIVEHVVPKRILLTLALT
jgi:hypothetical protein